MPTRGAGATSGTGTGDGERMDDGVGVGTRAGVGVPARAGGTGVVPRGGVIGTGVEVFKDADGGGRGERVRRVIGIVKVGEGDEEESESDDVDGWLAEENVRRSGGDVPFAVGGIGERGVGTEALRRIRAGRSGIGVDTGVLRPERVDISGVRAGDDTSIVPSADSGGAGVRAERGGTSVPLEVGTDAFGAGARIGTCGGTFSRGFGTRSASRMKRKSRPNS